ncbi:MAG: BTAD domain-containing putative transcriptional regulator [Actinomycetota bacterium]
MAQLAIHLLGRPSLERDGAPAPSPKGKKVWALLAYLIRSEAPVSRGRLASLLFADADDPLGTLRWNLAELRRVLGSREILRGEPIELDLPADTQVDLERVLHGTWRQAMSVPTIGEAFLEGLSFSTSPVLETWLLTERRHLANASASVMREAALGRLAAGAPADAVRLALKLIEIDPLDESYQALLIRSLAASGDRDGARAQLEACRALLMKELGVEPGPDVRNAVDAPTAPLPRSAAGSASARAQMDAGQAAIAAGAVDAGITSLRSASAEAEALGDASLQAQALLALGSSLIHAPRGRDEEGSLVLHKAIDVASEGGLDQVVAASRRELGYVEMLAARYDRARPWLEQALEAVGDDVGEEAMIRAVLGGCWSDTAHYPAAVAELERSLALAEEVGGGRQIAFTCAHLARVRLLMGDLDAARTSALRAKLTAEKEGWTSFVAWPESFVGDCFLAEGDLDGAADAYEHAFALGCQIGDPCWEGVGARGIGLVKERRGLVDEAIDWLDDARTRCVRIADAYMWIEAYCQDALCQIAISHDVDGALRFVDELEAGSASRGMREFVARAQLYRYRLGDEMALGAATLLAADIANPSLHDALEAAPRPTAYPGRQTATR